MLGPESAPGKGGVPPILWKIIIPAASGGATYLVSGLTHQPQEWALMLSTFVGGVILVVQFLIDFDRSLHDVEKRQARHAQTVGRHSPESLPGNQYCDSDLFYDRSFTGRFRH